MKKRFIYLVIFTAAVVFIISSVLFYVICAGLRKTSKEAAGKLNYIFSDKTYYNTIFVGPSTMHLGANPMFFDSLTGHKSNTFNAALDGFTLLEMDLVIHKYIKSHGAPKSIYLNIGANSLVTDSNIWFFPQYYPYVNDPDFAPFVERQHELLYGKYCPPLAMTYFNDPLRSLGLIGMLSHKSEPTEIIKLRGYAGSDRIGREEDPPMSLLFKQREDGWKILDETIDCCAKNSIKLTILITPMHNVTIPPVSINVINKLKRVALQHNVKVIDLLTDKRFTSAGLYADRRHLNSNGAKILSSILAEDFISNQ